jgi:L,D-transpeptidase YbiS
MRMKRRQLLEIVKTILEEDNTLSDAEDVYNFFLSDSVIDESDNFLIIDGPKQKYFLKQGGRTVKSGRVSTGAKGFGNASGSGKTSTGLMRVSSFHGAGLPDYAVLIGRKPTKPVTTLGPNIKGTRKGHPAEVLTRAITLKGLEAENQNVFKRKIYLHGTNRESLLGKPASGGCVRFSNDDIKDLADSLLSVGDLVFILGGKINLRQQKINQYAQGFDTTIDTLRDKGKQFMSDYGLLEDDTVNESNVVPTIGGVEASIEDVAKILDKYEIEPGA